MRREMFTMALSVFGGLVISGMLVGGGTAVAAESAAVSAETAASSSCYAIATQGNTPIYNRPSVGETVIGHMTKGKSHEARCSTVTPSSMGYYSACGGNSSKWVVLVDSKNGYINGYVKALCVSLQVDA